MVYRDGRKRKLRQGSLKKKAGSLLLAAAMLGTSFPAFSMEAYAADLPDSTQFAAVDDLKAFDTDDTNGTNSTLAMIQIQEASTNGGSQEARREI